MSHEAEKLDVRIFKLKDYIKRNPNKAYGYTCMGKLMLMSGRLSEAKDNFRKALNIDNCYGDAIIGLIEYHTTQRKLVAAVDCYNEHKYIINSKRVFQIRLAKSLSSVYTSGYWQSNSMNFISKIRYSYELHLVKNIHKKQPENLVVNLLLAIHLLNYEQSAYLTASVFKACVVMEGLNDDMRWKLVKELSKSDSAIYTDLEIARKFHTIPGKDCTRDYLNTIFEASLKFKKVGRLRTVFETFENRRILLNSKNLWKFVRRCTENGIYDRSVYRSCKMLLLDGWVDGVIADALLNIKKLHVIETMENEEKILLLYGYMN